MKKNNSLICYIKDKKDLRKITKETKYINLDLENIENDILSYFIENGNSFSYAEKFKNLEGYIYVDYNTLVKSESEIKKIIESIPSNLTYIEKIRYIYISLGKALSYDINTILEKNENFIFSNYSIINNLWGALSLKKITNLSIVKIFKYICNLLKIDCDIIQINDYGYLCNKLEIDGQVIIVDLLKDIPYIQGGFSTKYFFIYNSDLSLDKKIGYVSEDYNENILDKKMKIILNNEKFDLLKILICIQETLNIENIGPIELGIILEDIFKKYCPIENIYINNFYINELTGNKEHFILISNNNKYYSYNFRKKSFLEVSKQELIDNLENEKIGIYLGEEIPDLNIYSTKIMN